MRVILRAFGGCSGIRDSRLRAVAKTGQFSLNVAVTSSSQTVTVRLRLALMLAALMVRAVIPLGYMPGNVLAGEFMVLCPTGLPAGFALSGEHHHHADTGTMVDAERACPIGAALQQAALPTDFTPTALVDRLHDFSSASPPIAVFVHAPARYHSRAPPHAS